MFPAQQNVVKYQTNSQSKIPDAVITDKTYSPYLCTQRHKKCMCFVNKDKQYETNTICFPKWKIQHKSVYFINQNKTKKEKKALKPNC